MATVALALGCQQTDQALPFEPADGDGTTLTVGTAGGTVAVPPSFSIEFPAGALGGSVTVSVAPRTDAPFPHYEGTPVPGTAFDVDPSGTMLSEPARVQMAVDPALLEAGEDVRLNVALIRQDGSVSTFPGSYDITNGVLAAEIDEIGPVAAVVSSDAVAVAFSDPPALEGGAIPQPGPPAPAGPARSSHGAVEFAAACSPDARQCFSSGLVRLWGDEVIRDRLGDDLFLLEPVVDASLEFGQFVSGLPTELIGSMQVDGELRARQGRLLTRRALTDGIRTGLSTDPAPTTVQINGNLMFVGAATSQDGSAEFNAPLPFGITGIGTSDMLVVQLVADMEFANQDGSSETGRLTVHVRLRR